MISLNQFIDLFSQKYRAIEDRQLLLNMLREELQLLALEAVFLHFPVRLYFMGGTMLRLAYQIKRFSEDLDFETSVPELAFSTDQLAEVLASFFAHKTTGFQVTVKSRSVGNVKKVYLRFSELLHALRLSPLSGEKIHLKLEVDVNPPAGARDEQKRLQSLSALYYVNTPDLATAFTGKVMAILLREYEKGRDYFDLQWYLENHSDQKLNLAYLNAAVEQQVSGSALYPFFDQMARVKPFLEKKIAALRPEALRADLGRFVQMDPKTFNEWTARYQTETMALLDRYFARHET